MPSNLVRGKLLQFFFLLLLVTRLQLEKILSRHYGNPLERRLFANSLPANLPALRAIFPVAAGVKGETVKGPEQNSRRQCSIAINTSSLFINCLSRRRKNPFFTSCAYFQRTCTKTHGTANNPFVMSVRVAPPLFFQKAVNQS